MDYITVLLQLEFPIRPHLYNIRVRTPGAVAALSNKQQNAGMKYYYETDKQTVYTYNREQVQKLRYD